MRTILVGLMLLTVAAVAGAQDITIRGLNRARSSGWVYVDNGWIRNGDLVEVKFTVNSSMPGKIPVHWGFFDADKKLLGKFSGIPEVATKGEAKQELPETLEPNHTYSLSFPIPPSLASGAARWRTFAIELGAAPAASAIYPVAGEASDFSLAEKKEGADVASGDIKPVIKRIARYRNGLPALIDHEWVNGLDTLKVTVQLDSGAEAGDFFARLYLFDADKKKVFAWSSPPQVAIRAGGTYASLPASWKNAETYDLHFPIPAAYEQGPHQVRTAVVVFGDKQVVAAESYPAAGKWADFDFPEKASVTTP
jgi:hypothetical protein